MVIYPCRGRTVSSHDTKGPWQLLRKAPAAYAASYWICTAQGEQKSERKLATQTVQEKHEETQGQLWKTLQKEPQGASQVLLFHFWLLIEELISYETLPSYYHLFWGIQKKKNSKLFI